MIELSQIIMVIGVTSVAYQQQQGTISLGYAQTELSMPVGSESLKGINLKYRYETPASSWGAIISFTDQLNSSGELSSYNSRGFNFTNYSLLAGPVYRFNEYISLYGLVGFDSFKYFHGSFPNREKHKKNTLAYGTGIQINPVNNFAIDIAYERASHSGDMNTFTLNSFHVGLGYRF